MVAGYVLGENWHVIEESVGVYSKIVLAAVAVAAVVFVVNRVRRNRKPEGPARGWIERGKSGRRARIVAYGIQGGATKRGAGCEPLPAQGELIAYHRISFQCRANTPQT